MQAFKVTEKTIQACKSLIACNRSFVDKGGTPYAFHPYWVACEVAEFFADYPLHMTAIEEECILAALLHDMVEDTHLSLGIIRSFYGKNVADIVDKLTRRPDENEDAYYERICSSPSSIIVKFADLKHNSSLQRIPNPTERDKKRMCKYEKRINQLFPKFQALCGVVYC